MPDHQDYDKVKKAIEFLSLNFKNQPSLEVLSAEMGMSSSHFQRMFSAWAGISPKKFLQFTSLEHAKSLLRNDQLSLFDAAFETGLSGTGRLHDLFINIEAMTPAEYKHGGKSLNIEYEFIESVFGPLIVGSSSKGICHLQFYDDESMAVKELISCFPQASFQMNKTAQHSWIQDVLMGKLSISQNRNLHLKASPFQIKVWQALLRIPSGDLKTYGDIANEIGNAGASRAVGTAIGSNPIAYLIPCHRVIRATGEFGQYRWEASRKLAMIGLEASRLHTED